MSFQVFHVHAIIPGCTCKSKNFFHCSYKWHSCKCFSDKPIIDHDSYLQHYTDPLLQDPSYGEAVAFYDEAIEEEVTSEGSTIDFGTGVEVKVPEGVVAPNTSVTFEAQPAFASKDVFVLPSDIEAASPTYLLSSSSETLNGNVTLTIEHFMNLHNEEDAKNLVFLVADSKTAEDSTYRFKEVVTGHPVFKPGERVGTISTNHFSFWKIGRKIGKAVKKVFQGAVVIIRHMPYACNMLIFVLVFHL